MNMFLDGPASATVLPLSRRVLSIPRTSLGKWSMWLLAALVLLFCVFIAVSLTLDAAGIPVGTFRYWLILVPLISAVVSAVAAGVVALVAIFRRERSILMLLPLLVAAFVLFWTIGEMTESKPSTRSSTAQQFKTARQFASYLATQCGLPDNVELPDAAEEFAQQQGADQLIALLSKEFQAKTILHAHVDIARLVPWKYIYTTNYDNVLEGAFTLGGKPLRAVTLGDGAVLNHDVPALAAALKNKITIYTPPKDRAPLQHCIRKYEPIPLKSPLTDRDVFDLFHRLHSTTMSTSLIV